MCQTCETRSTCGKCDWIEIYQTRRFHIIDITQDILWPHKMLTLLFLIYYMHGNERTKLTVSDFRYQKDLTTLHAVLWDNRAKFPFSQVNLAAQYQLLRRGSTAPLRVQTNGKFNGFPKFPITLLIYLMRHKLRRW